MLLSRDELVSALFCETDRAQRMKMPLALIAIGLVDCVRRQAELGENLVRRGSDARSSSGLLRLLRCYDSVGRIADGEFVLILPGCSLFNAKTLAERLRDEVFESTGRGQRREDTAERLLRRRVERRPIAAWWFCVRRSKHCSVRGQRLRVDSMLRGQRMNWILRTFLLPVPQDESLHW